MKFSIQTFAVLVALVASAVQAAPHWDHDDHRVSTRTVTKTVAKQTTTSTKTKWSTQTKYRVSTKYIKERPRTITTCPRKNDWWHHDPKTVTRTKTLTVPGAGTVKTSTITQTAKETLTVPGAGTVVTVTPDATTITVPGDAETVTSTAAAEVTTVTVPGEVETTTTTTTEEATTVTVPTTVISTMTEEATTVTVPTTITSTTTEEAATVTVPGEPTTITSCAPTFSATQYFVNPSFEETDSAGKAIGWTVGLSNSVANVATGEVVSGGAYAGNNVFKVATTSPNSFSYVLSQTVTVETGKAYSVSFKVRSDIPTGPSGLYLVSSVEMAGYSFPTEWHIGGIFILKNTGTYMEVVTRPYYIPKGSNPEILVKVIISGGQAANIPSRIAYLDKVELFMAE